MGYDPQTYWQNRGKHYRPGTHGSMLVLTEDIFRYSVKWTDARDILDVGSGKGRMYKAVEDLVLDEDRIRQYRMCDFVESFRTACKKHTDILPDKWDGETLPYKDGRFDFVASVEVMIHVLPDKIEHFIDEHLRVTRQYLYVDAWDHTIDRRRESPARHCFAHHYRTMWDKRNLQTVLDFADYERGKHIWLLRKNRSTRSS
jgi:SAM-dependent methyltransferase